MRLTFALAAVLMAALTDGLCGIWKVSGGSHVSGGSPGWQ